MGGEVIIIAQDPDARTPDEPKVQVTGVQLAFSDDASPEDVSSAVRQVLSTAAQVRDS